ncbi:MAG: hypothetical protein SVU32_03960 [Candidatus Nanohaloarchaea archaeon]|nr:hypothetical protein [Candidatus Nanohaloarchaea archaeon]
MSERTTIFGAEEAEEESEHEKPFLENGREGAAAWLNKDKNGNAYISVRLPLNLGSLNLFPTNEKVEDALNQLLDYLEEQDFE